MMVSWLLRFGMMLLFFWQMLLFFLEVPLLCFI